MSKASGTKIMHETLLYLQQGNQKCFYEIKTDLAPVDNGMVVTQDKMCRGPVYMFRSVRADM